MTSEHFYGQVDGSFPIEQSAIGDDGQHLIDHKLWFSIEPSSLPSDADLFFRKLLKRAPILSDLQIFPALKPGIFAKQFNRFSDMRRLIQFLTIKNLRVEIPINKDYFSTRSLYAVSIRLDKKALGYSSSELEKMLLVPTPSMILADPKSEMRLYYLLEYCDESEFEDIPVDEIQREFNRHLFLSAHSGVDPSMPLPGSLCQSPLGVDEQSFWSTISFGDIYSPDSLLAALKDCISNSPDLQYFSLDRQAKTQQVVSLKSYSYQDVMRSYESLEDVYTPSAYLCSLRLFYSLVAALVAISPRDGSAVKDLLISWQVDIPPLFLHDAQKIATSCQELAQCYWALVDNLVLDDPAYASESSCLDNQSAPALTPALPPESLPNITSGETVTRHAKDDLAKLKEYTLQVCSDSDIDPMDQLTLVRAYAKTLSTSFDLSYLQQQILQSVRQIHGTSDGIGIERPVDFSPVPWLWEKVFIQKAANLLVAHPKCGKTSLVISFIQALLEGETSFLDFPVYRTYDPSVLIVGTDQPESDWGRMLAAANLLTESNHLRPGIVDLYTATNPLHLDTPGIQKIISYAKEHPGLIIFLDSLAACTLPLGIDENSSQAVIPIMRLINEVSVFDSTIIIVHHSSKSSFAQSASSASRGTSAIPAAMSQIISLERFCPEDAKPETGDNRLVLKTQGRAGSPIKQIIQRTESGWINLGCGERTALIQKQNNIIEELTDRQRAVYSLLEDRWNAGEHPTTAEHVKESLPGLFVGADPDRSIRSVFEQLHRKKLATPRLSTKPTQWCLNVIQVCD